MKILLADDSPEVRSALRLLLELEPVPATVLEASDRQSLVKLLRENCPTVVLLDWELPGLQRGDIQDLLRSSCPDMKVVAMSSRYEARREALAAGVDAFVSKAEPAEKILAALYAFIPG